ncbi:1-(5-phosphoribosyl)-5-[(5-phosphoribosylamino)methylideneamino]imidazole-4-carboxamide isomerase [Acidiphilium acidophilum]|uniref:1-(5-phosphoribosyl)-5-[(5-phosphoribosylamino)methylideneamino] imidazole-4-carboxamide isomerase n=1 Tax=Acidiphilium acidophilum TaxID=76588 RepID=A0AAW9DQA4_ACIAO|nr:1-(5-phosphoribosyl)-5-[(5-phosphoribosylamino)methylideneamino]imidazole-4-carboxamide isomerase [Acidiphilium acidophilum]MDX5930603.1 1-(5-phosphoribosyl)-5-[(5-phosphoribosylamino)methylideneamino]imidazole-4-carboxamide isomerase [Acidiphilium acidophilum]
MALTLYPAIDLKDGACVRLRRGAMDQATIYADDPASQARAFQQAGFEALHVVDLNGAFAGHGVNQAAVRAISEAVSLPIQLGGGIRDMAGIEAWFDLGIARIILGSVAVKNPQLVRTAAAAFPGRIIVGIDASDGMVATEGWAEISTISATDLAVRLEDAGICAIIHTDIARDGMLAGLNLEATEALARSVTIPVIASGGVAGLADIIALREAASRTPNLAGTIIGRALYDGRIDAAAALAAARAC